MGKNKNKIYSLLALLHFCVLSLFVTEKASAAEPLFSVAYGNNDSQIGLFVPNQNGEDNGPPIGPSVFFADAEHGTIYIADLVAGGIKKFDLTGKFLSKVSIDAPLSISIDGNENIYVVHGATSGTVTKFNKEGGLLWTKSLSEIIPISPSYQGIGFIRNDSNNNLYLESYSKNKKGCIKLNSNGIFLEEVPSCQFDEKGNYYAFTSIKSYGDQYTTSGRNYPGDYESAAEIVILDLNKSTQKEIDVSLPEEFTNSHMMRDVNKWYVDMAGNIYASCFMVREKDKEVLLQNGLQIKSDQIIYKYNPQGNIISKMEFLSSPTPDLTETIQIDNKGNLYYLQFYADKMDVVKVPPTIPFQQFSLKHWRIHWDQGKHDKNKFQLSGRIDLPDDYTTDMLKKQGAVTIAIEKNAGEPFSGNTTLNFTQNGPIWRYKAPKGQSATEQPLSIEKMLIFWQPEGSEDKPDKQGHAGKGHGKRAGWFMIQGNINISDTDQAALLPKAALTLNIPVENITTAGALESREEIEFKVHKNLWSYNAAPHNRWQDWQESWWEKVKED